MNERDGCDHEIGSRDLDTLLQQRSAQLAELVGT